MMDKDDGETEATIETTQLLLDGIDLERESAKSLLRTSRRFRRHWYKHRLVSVGICVSMIVLGLIFEHFYPVQEMQAKFELIREARKQSGEVISILDAILLEPGRFVLTFVAPFLLAIGGMFAILNVLLMLFGKPKARKKYQDTIGLYIAKSLNLSLLESPLCSYVCLLQCARDTIQDDYVRYVRYCSMVTSEIKSRTKNLLGIGDEQGVSIDFSTESIDVIGSLADLRVCRTTVKMKASAENEAYFVVDLPVALVGKHWYIGTLDWIGHISRSLSVPEEERTSVSLTPSSLMLS